MAGFITHSQTGSRNSFAAGSDGTIDLGNGWSRKPDGSLVQTGGGGGAPAAPAQPAGGQLQMPSGPSPQSMVRSLAEAKPEASVASLAAVSGAPEPADVGFMGAGPGVLRPGLPTYQPPPDDGGLRALKRKVY